MKNDTVSRKAGDPAFVIVDGDTYLGNAHPLLGTNCLVVYDTLAEAGKVALSHPSASVVEARWMDFLKLAKAKGWGVIHSEGGEQYLISYQVQASAGSRMLRGTPTQPVA